MGSRRWHQEPVASAVARPAPSSPNKRSTGRGPEQGSFGQQNDNFRIPPDLLSSPGSISRSLNPQQASRQRRPLGELAYTQDRCHWMPQNLHQSACCCFVPQYQFSLSFASGLPCASESVSLLPEFHNKVWLHAFLFLRGLPVLLILWCCKPKVWVIKQWVFKTDAYDVGFVQAHCTRREWRW